jgi:hypothetical protein
MNSEKVDIDVHFFIYTFWFSFFRIFAWIQWNASEQRSHICSYHFALDSAALNNVEHTWTLAGDLKISEVEVM